MISKTPKEVFYLKRKGKITKKGEIFSNVSKIFENPQTICNNFFSVIESLEAFLYHLSNFSVVSVIAETKFITP